MWTQACDVIQWMGRSVPNCHIGPLHGRRASPSVDMEVHASQWRRTRTAASSSSSAFPAFWRRKFFQTGDRMKMLIAFERLFVCPPTMNERKAGPLTHSLPSPPLRQFIQEAKEIRATRPRRITQPIRRLSAAPRALLRARRCHKLAINKLPRAAK